MRDRGDRRRSLFYWHDPSFSKIDRRGLRERSRAFTILLEQPKRREHQPTKSARAERSQDRDPLTPRLEGVTESARAHHRWNFADLAYKSESSRHLSRLSSLSPPFSPLSNERMMTQNRRMTLSNSHPHKGRSRLDKSQHHTGRNSLAATGQAQADTF